MAAKKRKGAKKKAAPRKKAPPKKNKSAPKKKAGPRKKAAPRKQPVPPATSRKKEFLDQYEREHAITEKILNAYPKDMLDLRPHPSCRTAKELAWVFWAERMLGQTVYNDKFLEMSRAGGAPPPPPDSWDAILAAIAKAHKDLGDMVRAAKESDLDKPVHFFTAPGKVGGIPRIQFLWFLLSDEIHHRGQFSIYLRCAGAKVPSIYGPSKDEPWM
jgi:uncharacterized damage-inducible protein DinB